MPPSSGGDGAVPARALFLATKRKLKVRRVFLRIQALSIPPSVLNVLGGVALLLLTSALWAGGATQARAQQQQADPSNPSAEAKALSDACYGLIGEGHPEQALPKCREAVRLAPGFGEAHKNLGLALTELARFDEAIPVLREAVRLAPGLDKAHNVLGKALYGKGRRKEAIVSYREAVRISPAYAKAHYNLGLALSDEGESE